MARVSRRQGYDSSVREDGFLSAPSAPLRATPMMAPSVYIFPPVCLARETPRETVNCRGMARKEGEEEGGGRFSSFRIIELSSLFSSVILF